MKKTVNINVSGIIFHIDEDAYIKLNSYLIPVIRIMTGYSNRVEVSTTIEARGRTISDAKKHTRDVNYQIRHSGDTLFFPPP